MFGDLIELRESRRVEEEWVTLNFAYLNCHSDPAEVYREVETITPTPQVIMKTLVFIIVGCLFFALGKRDQNPQSRTRNNRL